MTKPGPNNPRESALGVSARIRVLVVDDSALMRKRISEMINSDPDLEVIATARNGEEAVRAVFLLKPDAVTLDIELPVMNGLTALKYIMSEFPTPVIVLSAYTKAGADITMQSLESGAFDVVAKPSGVISLDIDKVGKELISKIKATQNINIGKLRPILVNEAEEDTLEIKTEAKKGKPLSDKVVAIASSTGGPRALMEVIPALDGNIPASIVIVQHMPVGFTASFAERLDWGSKISVREAREGDPLKKGEALVAPGGFHLAIERDGRHGVVRLETGPKDHGVCPSADRMMISAASLYAKNCLGVVLTGMGDDGTDGLREIKKHGGATIAEDKSTAVVYGMPKSAFDAGVVDKVLPLPEIAGEIMKNVNLKK